MHVRIAVREAATYAPAPASWPFDLDSGVRVTCDVGCLLGLSVLNLGPMYATDRCVRQHHRLMPLPVRGEGIIMSKIVQIQLDWLLYQGLDVPTSIGRTFTATWDQFWPDAPPDTNYDSYQQELNPISQAAGLPPWPQLLLGICQLALTKCTMYLMLNWQRHFAAYSYLVHVDAVCRRWLSRSWRWWWWIPRWSRWWIPRSWWRRRRWTFPRWSWRRQRKFPGWTWRPRFLLLCHCIFVLYC